MQGPGGSVHSVGGEVARREGEPRELGGAGRQHRRLVVALEHQLRHPRVRRELRVGLGDLRPLPLALVRHVHHDAGKQRAHALPGLQGALASGEGRLLRLPVAERGVGEPVAEGVRGDLLRLLRAVGAKHSLRVGDDFLRGGANLASVRLQEHDGQLPGRGDVPEERLCPGIACLLAAEKEIHDCSHVWVVVPRHHDCPRRLHQHHGGAGLHHVAYHFVRIRVQEHCRPVLPLG
mmetsp:Transcript_77344/g.244379  ORF Transcript_77344/g.244379 Transcript_77344/m.244379 type:complete len:234 (-) Transcript_77344:1640-2341(-)